MGMILVLEGGDILILGVGIFVLDGEVFWYWRGDNLVLEGREIFW